MRTASSILMAATADAAPRNAIVTAPYTVSAPRPYSRPPIAGPRIIAVWFAEVDHAVACCSCERATRFGSNAAIDGDSNARAAPVIIAIA